MPRKPPQTKRRQPTVTEQLDQLQGVPLDDPLLATAPVDETPAPVPDGWYEGVEPTIDPSQSADEIARGMAPAMLSMLHRIATARGLSEAARVAAAKEILDRGHGKPTQAIITVPMRTSKASAMAGLTDEQLEAAIAARRIAQGYAPRATHDAAPPLEAEYTDLSDALTDTPPSIQSLAERLGKPRPAPALDPLLAV